MWVAEFLPGEEGWIEVWIGERWGVERWGFEEKTCM